MPTTSIPAAAPAPAPAPSIPWRYRLLTLAPLGAIAWLALILSGLPALSQLGVSPLMLAMCAGMVACNTLPRHWLAPLAPGMQLARQTLLRLGVALYGLRLTFGSIEALGVGGVVAPLLMLAATLCVGVWIGTRWLGLTRREAVVVSAGSAVCGAAAAIAVASIARTDDRQTAVAVATVVLFGTVGMLLYPYLYELVTNVWHWQVGERPFGIYTGATLHEVAQVIVAGKAVGETAGDAAVLAKMVRVLALGPLLLVLALWPRAEDRAQGTDAGRRGIDWARIRAAVPWFALGFVAVLAINSFGLVPGEWKPALVAFDNWLLACAMLAIGLHTRIGDLLGAGRKPMLLAALLFVFLVGAGALLCAVLL
ncbi:putative sulfate exporter family transporter [Cupriavidus gilardii]|uniref:YeiH family protein n=1 Tax=Cupriavidus gilardii TaxID=82541 RepID=UPI0021C204B8|nr:putative sulfate exporter family transporter [Cupriavidus gilardii]MCT9114748.1 putative sulfate exporter family transporter [Cupriavidus gilardii]